MIALLSIVSLLASFTSAATPAEWRSMSIYQVMVDRFGRTDNSTTAPCDTSLMDYCGGTWRGIINHLDYIQGMGFDAVWISPVNANIPKGYHGYWTQDFYAENPEFGTADDLKALSAALHARKMSLMVDVAVNDMGLLGTDTAVDYAGYNPFNDQKYFHPFCNITDFTNQTDYQLCWLSGLPDLKTDDTQVANILNSWIKDLVSNFSIDGLRVDAAKHIQSEFWPAFESAAGVYAAGEVYDGNATELCPFQNVLSGVSNYPVHFPLIRAFQATNASTDDLVTEFNGVKKTCKDPSLLFNFVENADVVRFASLTNDTALAKNAVAFMMLSDGIPSIYQGLEQHLDGGADPANREALWLTKYSTTSELYTHITSLNAIRKMAMGQSANYTTTSASIIYNDTSTVAMMKGVNGSELLTVASNKGANVKNYTLNIGSTNYTSNEQLVQLFDCSVVIAGDKGSLAIPMDGQPKVFYPATALYGSKLCPGQQKKSGSASSGNNSTNPTSGASHSSSMGLVAPVSFLLLVLGSLLL